MKEQKLYTKKYSPNGETISIRGFDIPIPLPDRPRDRDIMNYGLPVKDQRFKRERLPTNKEYDLMSYDEKRAFCEIQWHKRLNGEWWFIKGNAYYIPGKAWYFFNYWHLQKGPLPTFRMEAVDYFLVDEFIENYDMCLGKDVVKCRRAGETEKELCSGYELVTRYASSHFGMMNTVEAEAKKNYLRLVSSHKKMRPWFRATTRDDSSQSGLIFEYDHMKMDGEPDELGSSITYKPTKLRSYDGWELRKLHWDEIGKIKPSDIDIEAQLEILNETLALENGSYIVGKMSCTSTVEDLANGKTVAVCKRLWKASDPKLIEPGQMTPSRLIRYFRGFWVVAPVDEFGIHDVAKGEAIRAARIKELLASGDTDKLSRYKRKFPARVEEALSISEAYCILHPALLEIQQAKIDLQVEAIRSNPAAANAKQMPIAEPGDLIWEKNFGGNVVWIPNPNGKFLISQHPPPGHANKATFYGGYRAPGNAGMYSMGIDPVDHMKSNSREGSDFGIAVFRNFNIHEEKDVEIEYREDGTFEIVGGKEFMVTNRFVCSYRNRPLDPNVAYEDALKCAIYYGVAAFTETQKPGVTFYFNRSDMANYLAWKHPMIKIGAKPNTPGMAQSATSTQFWVDLAISHVYRFSETFVHPDIIADYRSFTGDNATDCDLVVACGYALMMAKPIEAAEQRRLNSDWSDLPFDTYD